MLCIKLLLNFIRTPPPLPAVKKKAPVRPLCAPTYRKRPHLWSDHLFPKVLNIEYVIAAETPCKWRSTVSDMGHFFTHPHCNYGQGILLQYLAYHYFLLCCFLYFTEIAVGWYDWNLAPLCSGLSLAATSRKSQGWLARWVFAFPGGSIVLPIVML